MDRSDRITIRLEQEILARMEDFLRRNPRFRSRSQLCRIAVDEFLESAEGFSQKVTVEIPKAYLDFIDALVEKGYFLNREHGVQRLIEESLDEERVTAIIKHHETMGSASGKIFPVELQKKDSAGRA